MMSKGKSLGCRIVWQINKDGVANHPESREVVRVWWSTIRKWKFSSEQWTGRWALNTAIGGRRLESAMKLEMQEMELSFVRSTSVGD